MNSLARTDLFRYRRGRHPRAVGIASQRDRSLWGGVAPLSPGTTGGARRFLSSDASRRPVARHRRNLVWEQGRWLDSLSPVVCRRMNPRLLGISVLLIALVSVAGCGGGSSTSPGSTAETSAGGGEPTKAEFIEQADAICTSNHGDTDSLEKEAAEIEKSANPESPKNLLRLADILREASESAESEYQELRELEPPAADEATVDAMFSKAEEGKTFALEAAEALEEGETSKFSELLKKAEPVDTSAKGMAEGYGFKVCGKEE